MAARAKFAADATFVIASGGGILDGVNPNANYRSSTTERRQRRIATSSRRSTGAPVSALLQTISATRTTSALHPVNSAAPITLFPELRPARDHTLNEPAGHIEPANPRYVPDDARGYGRDGVAGTADDGRSSSTTATHGVNQTFSPTMQLRQT
jgi:hypothetical protein